MFRIGRQILLGTRHIQHTPKPIRIAPRRCLASRKESVEVYKGAAARLRQSEASDRVRQKRPDVIRFLDEHNQRPAPSGKPRTIITNCPHCLKVRKASFAAYVELDTGKYSCKTCHANGSWSTFTKALKEKLQSSDNYAFYTPSDILKGSSSPAFSRPVQEVENYPHQLQQNAPMLEKLTTQYKLDAETIRKYKVGLADYADPSARLKEATQQGGEGGNQTKSSDQPCYTFPQTTLTYTFSDNGSEATPKEEFREETVRVKACSLDDVNRVVVYDPPNISESRSAGLFGYHLATAEDQAVILTRRELDAMAAYQATGIPSFALPTMYYQLHESVLPLLQRFSKIYIWLDDDLDGQVAAERFAKKLGEARCLLVSTKGGDPEGPKAAHEALMQGKNLKDMLSAARHVKHEQILDFTDLREEVYREIMNPEQTQGVQSTDLPALNKILKGHRPGELTILTGPTGMGKTTVISQLSLDYCKSGVPTLWGSFEIANKRLAKKMLYQFSGKDLSKHPEEFSVWADQFEQLPLYFLKFFSSTPIREVLKACNHAVYAYDVRHIILDNLQFMLSQQGRSSLDRWELQDDAVAELRAFATNHDVHITLVVHPRKDPGDQLDINSVFGSAKVTQEADNVIILQKGDDLGARHLDIKKNRYDGTLGTILYKFEPESLKIKGLSKEEVDAIVERKKKETSSVYSPMRHVQTRR